MRIVLLYSAQTLQQRQKIDDNLIKKIWWFLISQNICSTHNSEKAKRASFFYWFSRFMCHYWCYWQKLSEHLENSLAQHIPMSIFDVRYTLNEFMHGWTRARLMPCYTYAHGWWALMLLVTKTFMILFYLLDLFEQRHRRRPSSSFSSDPA